MDKEQMMPIDLIEKEKTILYNCFSSSKLFLDEKQLEEKSFEAERKISFLPLSYGYDFIVETQNIVLNKNKNLNEYDELLIEISEAFDTIKVHTSKKGRINEITNVKELEQKFSTIAEKLKTEYVGEVFDSIIEGYYDTLNDEGWLINSINQYAFLGLFFNDWWKTDYSFLTDKVQERTIENFINTNSLHLVEKRRLINKNDEFIKLSLSAELDKSKLEVDLLKNALAEFLERDVDLEKMYLQGKGEVIFDAYTGWLFSIDYTILLELENFKKEIYYKITREEIQYWIKKEENRYNQNLKELKVRDKHKEVYYFDSFIKQREQYQLLFFNDIKEEKIKLSKSEINTILYQQNLQKWLAMYSMGTRIEEVAGFYYDLLEYYLASDYDCHTNYEKLLQMLSIGILIQIEEEDLILLDKLVKKMQEPHKDGEPLMKQDCLIDYLFKSRFPNRAISSGKLSEKYESLYKIIKLSKIEAIKKIESYLENWYEMNKDTIWYNYHKKTNDVYFGYWAFEVAAIVKIMNLDDSSFKENPYYPYDLVHWIGR